MSYVKQNWTTGDTITASKMNHIEDGIIDNGYDLVISSIQPVNTGVQNISDWSIIQGSITNIEEKLENGLPINAIAIVWESQWSVNPPNDTRYYLPLIEFLGPYNMLCFSGMTKYGVDSTSATTHNIFANFQYDNSSKILTKGILSID